MMKTLKYFLTIICVIYFLACLTVYAQDQTTLQIYVIDQNLAKVSQASIQLKNMQGRLIKQIELSTFSENIFSNLNDEDYILEVSSIGFKASVQKIRVLKGKNSLTAKLEIEEIKANVDVTKSDVETRLDEVFNTNLTQAQIDALPENPNEIADELKRRYGDDLVIRVDGFSGGQIPPKSQIASIHVTRSSFDAEFHEIGQTIIDIKTKAGGKVFFGFVNLFYNNSFLNARNSSARTRLPSQNINTFGFLTFPSINKERTSFSLQFINFFSYRVNNIIAILPGGQINNRIKSGSKNISPTFNVTHNINKNQTLNVKYILGKNDLSNLGVGGFSLPERAYANDTTSHTIQTFESGNIKRVASQFRLEFVDNRSKSLAENNNPSINVIGAFNKGGAGVNNKSRQQKLFLSEIVYFDYGKNAFKFGGETEYEKRKLESADNLNGSFVFSSLADYLNNKPYSFSQRQKTTVTNLEQLQLAGFIQDDVRLRKNFQIGLGLRYERQNNLRDQNNFSPRLSFVWSPDREAKIAVRSGIGLFYQWLETTTLSTILSNDGRSASNLIIINPGYPNPLVNGIIGNSLPPSILRKDNKLQNPYIFIAKTVVNYRINAKLKLESIYTFRRGVHQFRSRDINAPINGQRPDFTFGRISQVESSGNSQENILEMKLDGSLKKGFSFDVIYRIGKIISDFEDVFGLPVDNYNLSAERAFSNLDQRHRFSSRFSLPSWKSFAFSTTFRLESPRPYTITTGRDDNRDSVINDRPLGFTRNSERGDWLKQVDAIISWRTKLGKENAKDPLSKIKNQIVLTSTIQNLFNQTNKQNFIGIQTSPFFQQAISAAPARTIQFGLSYIF